MTDKNQDKVKIEIEEETNKGGDNMVNENQIEANTENEGVNKVEERKGGEDISSVENENTNKHIVDSFESNEFDGLSVGCEQMDLVFILDRSGSMHSAVDDTISGFNSFIERQLIKEHDIRVTTVLFDHDYEVLHSRKPISEVKPLDKESYFVRGSTALLDAIGRTVSTYEREIHNKTLCIINTDGFENSSIEFSRDQIKQMIGTSDWEFIFIGADIDSYAEASRIGIKMSHTANFSKSRDGIRDLYADIDCATDIIYSNEKLEEKNWKKNLDKY